MIYYLKTSTRLPKILKFKDIYLFDEYKENMAVAATEVFSLKEELNGDIHYVFEEKRLTDIDLSVKIISWTAIHFDEDCKITIVPKHKTRLYIFSFFKDIDNKKLMKFELKWASEINGLV